MLEAYHWVVLVAAVPLLEGLYYTAVIFGGGRLGYSYQPDHQFLLHIPFIYTVAAVLLTLPLSVPVDIAVWYAVVPLVGVALYYLPTLVWTRITDTEIHLGGRSLTYAAPTVLAAPAEELLFRGALLPVVDEWGSVAFVAGSAAIFGLAHLVHRRREVLFKIFNGAVYAVLLLATGSILVPMLAHVGHNLAYARVATGPTPDPTK